MSSFASGSYSPADQAPVGTPIMAVVTIEVNGQVVRKPFGTGTKSEREAIYLATPQGEYLLRRPAANPFELDPELNSLVGKKVRVSGTISGYTFFVSDWQVNEHI